MHVTNIEGAIPSAGLRAADIRRALLERRRQLSSEIEGRVREVRQAGSGSDHAAVAGDPVDADPEDDLPFALIHMKGELLQRLDHAVRRCDDGTYGFCLECGLAIPPSRLRAVPFAVRCRPCEEAHEARRHRGRSGWRYQGMEDTVA
jgi:DnaK suppressor protein